VSRFTAKPLPVPPGVEVMLQDSAIVVALGDKRLSQALSPLVEVKREDGALRVSLRRKGNRRANAMAGTTCALIRNMLTGVSRGFERKLLLQGVGYRAQIEGGALVMQLGYSHPVRFSLPEGIAVETPSPTEVVIRGTDKQQVGQFAARVRAARPPEPYKGKGIRYADEQIRRKEPSKKG